MLKSEITAFRDLSALGRDLLDVLRTAREEFFPKGLGNGKTLLSPGTRLALPGVRLGGVWPFMPAPSGLCSARKRPIPYYRPSPSSSSGLSSTSSWYSSSSSRSASRSYSRSRSRSHSRSRSRSRSRTRTSSGSSSRSPSLGSRSRSRSRSRSYSSADSYSSTRR